jgi:transposase InsO family protein
MELQAALIAARLAATIQKELSTTIQQTTLWTDSSTVLAWIRTDPRKYSVFVANRLGEIDELYDAEHWRWVPTADNPADVGTRDNDPPDLSQTGLWFGGPDFLRRAGDNWPLERTMQTTATSAEMEVKREYLEAAVLRETPSQSIPDSTRFSSWERFIRTTAWVLRFISRCRKKGPTGELITEELRRAEVQWMRGLQDEAFHRERADLASGKAVSTSSRLYRLTPRLGVDGLIRMSSRLEERIPGASLPIVDGKQHSVRLFIRSTHEKLGHAGVERTVAEVRTTIVVLQLRTAVRKMVLGCLLCRQRRAVPVPPLMAPLPEARMAPQKPPFTNCGVDFFGPIYVTIGRRREKRYGVLFTCLTTRAIHLEVAASLDADAAIMALRRMSARRGTPDRMYSDNGTNFVAADKEIRQAVDEVLNDPKWSLELAQKRMEWVFIPPGAPHMGGAWERLVRSVKRALHHVLKSKAPRLDTLHTALAEIEYTINNRPLTHICSDPGEDAPLTPNHFLLGGDSRPCLAFYEAGTQDVPLKKQWQTSQQLADHFWRRWVREYLPTIAKRQKWHTATRPLEVGDVVLIVDSNQPRDQWPLGRITATHPGKDGQVRAVTITNAAGRQLRRPATRAIMLPTSEE